MPGLFFCRAKMFIKTKNEEGKVLLCELFRKKVEIVEKYGAKIKNV